MSNRGSEKEEYTEDKMHSVDNSGIRNSLQHDASSICSLRIVRKHNSVKNNEHAIHSSLSAHRLILITS